MTKPQYTHLIFVLDGSGSMYLGKPQTLHAVNDFFNEQKKLSEECTYSLYTFSDEIRTITSFAPLPSFSPLTESTYVTQGNTALFDAVGGAIMGTGEKLSALQEDQRPSQVICVIFTDGQENASTQFSQQQIKNLIEQQKKEYSWQFIFMGSGKDTWEQAVVIGVAGIGTQTYSFSHTDPLSAGTTYRSLGDTVKLARQKKQTLTGKHETH